MANSQRVRWLEKAYKILRDELIPNAPAKACVSVSVTTSRRAIGQHFDSYRAADGKSFIAIHPKLFGSGYEVLKTELHEMVHAALGNAKGHGPEFRSLAKAIGFVAPWTSSTLSADLEKKLKAIGDRLGDPPKAQWLEPTSPTPETITVECGCPRLLPVPTDFLKGGAVKCMTCKKLFKAKKGVTK